MTTYYKAVRPDGADFRTGAIPPDPLAPAHRKALSDALKGKTP